MQTTDALTATATDTAGNTSEFGVNSVANLTPTAVSDADTAVEAGVLQRINGHESNRQLVDE